MAIPYRNILHELWGGIECSINRVGDVYQDQLEDVGHYDRPGDIDLIGALGIKKLRYPILWERHEPEFDHQINWDWTQERLQAIRSYGIEPIAGLLHHGSGPAFTNLLDRKFPVLLAAYAEKVAQKFPWINYYTPVNEPLTTARFSGLYGFWYPHRKNDSAFYQMLVNELLGTVYSMKKIRAVNPAARLIQTEDIAKTHSTPGLAYQARFENERRWLSYDLLCGKVDNNHYFWKLMIAAGIPAKTLHYFLDNPCVPDVMGFNYYVTSERWLDEQIHKYPASTHGGNGLTNYADVEAVRTKSMQGLQSLLKEAWNRYKLPLAITECHLDCSREEQLRWLKETWDTACNLNQQGIIVKAVTAWSLLGAHDWNSLLTERRKHYQPGSFDVSNHKPRPTALVNMIKGLAKEGSYKHPVLEGKGWWRRNDCLAFNSPPARMSSRPVMIIGKNGTLGHAFIEVCGQRSISNVAFSRKEIDIRSRSLLTEAIRKFRPWAIINTAGFVDVEKAESEKQECYDLNCHGVTLLAEICRESAIQLITFSTDLVFDGNKQADYHEDDLVNPINVYGSSKAAAERSVLRVNPDVLVIRSSAFFGPWDRHNFAYKISETLKNKGFVPLANDVTVSPTYVPDLVNASMDLMIDKEKGIWHIANKGAGSWADWGKLIASHSGFTVKDLCLKKQVEMGWKAKIPSYSAIASTKGIRMPSVEDALTRYFKQRGV